jgi:hypothetical protein
MNVIIIYHYRERISADDVLLASTPGEIDFALQAGGLYRFIGLVGS